MARKSGSARRVRAEADAAEASARATLDGFPTPEQLETLPLDLDPGQRPTAGSRPACLLRAPDGQRYFFKSAPAGLVAAEMLAYDVRRLGRRPAPATASRHVELPGVGEVEGMLQPLLDGAGTRLSTDPLAWTDVQREVLLREHPWEWLLANLDTHVDQYVLWGPAQIPLNLDWDHALEDLGIDELDRSTKRSFAIAPIRNALYDAYARGDLDLHFRGLLREARRIARLDDFELERALADWAQRAGVDDARRRDVVTRFFARKRRLPETFLRFVGDLRRERVARRPGSPIDPVAWARVTTLDAWQRLVIGVLHDRVVVPWLRTYRKLLHVKDAFAAPPASARRSPPKG